MAAPAHTTRSTPVGEFLKDGYQALIAFAADPDVSCWEKSVKPPGVDGGDSINITTMHNVTYRTMSSSPLKTLTEATSKVAYDPALYPQIVALINVEGAITVHFSNGDKLSFFGYLKSFEADDMSEGTQPEATIAIVPTNYEPVAGVEAAAVLGTS